MWLRDYPTLTFYTFNICENASSFVIALFHFILLLKKITLASQKYRLRKHILIYTENRNVSTFALLSFQFGNTTYK